MVYNPIRIVTGQFRIGRFDNGRSAPNKFGGEQEHTTFYQLIELSREELQREGDKFCYERLGFNI